MVLVGAGDYLTKEALAAIDILRKDVPTLRTRFVNILTLSSRGIGVPEVEGGHRDLDLYFTKERPVIINFHGYPQTIKQTLFDYGYSSSRFFIHGYEESGSTTTPFDMHVRNGTDRYTLAREAVEQGCAQGALSRSDADMLAAKYTRVLKEHRTYIIEYGVDPEHIENWQWSTSR